MDIIIAFLTSGILGASLYMLKNQKDAEAEEAMRPPPSPMRRGPAPGPYRLGGRREMPPDVKEAENWFPPSMDGEGSTRTGGPVPNFNMDGDVMKLV